MTKWLERILIWAAGRLPDSQGAWAEDLRYEAQHVPAGYRRLNFLWSGVQAAFGEFLRVSIGPKRLGQALFGCAGFAACIALFYAAIRLDDQTIKSAFFILLTLYGIAAGLAVLNLKLLKRYSLSAIFCLLLTWVILGTPLFSTADLPIDYLRALSIEASGVMMSLFIGASYLGWVETPNHA